MSKTHQKHAKLAKPASGEWGRTELALTGTSSPVIRDLVAAINTLIGGKWSIGFVDSVETPGNHPAGQETTFVHLTEANGITTLNYSGTKELFRQRYLFNDTDLVLVNGNHFTAQQQVLFIDPARPVAIATEQLNEVVLVLLKDITTGIPGYLQSYTTTATVLPLTEITSIAAFFDHYLAQRIAPVNGLILAGGQSTRMGADKGLLDYHGTNQRDYVRRLMQPFCKDVYISCNAAQSASITEPKIEDRFIGIGPMAGILSAFQSAPDTAWLTVACDLPLLDHETLAYLLAHRDAGKLATAFLNEASEFPEPLITIWEPRAYPVLLNALANGISCPRKVLINSSVALLRVPDSDALLNVNDPAAYQLVKQRIDKD